MGLPAVLALWHSPYELAPYQAIDETSRRRRMHTELSCEAADRRGAGAGEHDKRGNWGNVTDSGSSAMDRAAIPTSARDACSTASTSCFDALDLRFESSFHA